MKKKVYLYCPNFPGVRTHLQHVQKLLENLNIKVIFLDEHFAIHDIDYNSTVIFGAWLPAYERLFRTFKSKNSNIKIIVSWCSPLSQLILENDFQYLLQAINNPHIDYLFLSRDEGKILSEIYPKIQFFPAPYNIPENKMVCEPHEHFNIAMFNCNTPRKNTLVQLAALHKISNIFLYTNFPDTTFGLMLKNFQKCLQLNHRNQGWIPTKEYQQIMANIDLGMQITFCEGFNYVLAEHFSNGTPVLVSGANPIIGNNDIIHQYLVVKDIASADEIISKIQVLKRDTALRYTIGLECKKQLEQYSDWANPMCSQILKEIII